MPGVTLGCYLALLHLSVSPYRHIADSSTSPAFHYLLRPSIQARGEEGSHWHSQGMQLQAQAGSHRRVDNIGAIHTDGPIP
jgi:hypothetical protein